MCVILPLMSEAELLISKKANGKLLTDTCVIELIRRHTANKSRLAFSPLLKID